jgi:hypothetical protein
VPALAPAVTPPAARALIGDESEDDDALENKNAVIYGTGASEVRSCGVRREGARLFLAGRTLAGVQASPKS